MALFDQQAGAVLHGVLILGGIWLLRPVNPKPSVQAEPVEATSARKKSK